MTPSGTRGVLNDAISIYYADATLASAFVARWYVGSKTEAAGGVFPVREDEPTPRVGRACTGAAKGKKSQDPGGEEAEAGRRQIARQERATKVLHWTFATSGRAPI